MSYSRASCSLFSALLAVTLWSATVLAQTVVSLNPRATYLHVCSDPALNAR